MTTPVSVIIPCYRQGRFLADAIRSALEQDHPCTEIVVVDDGSPDETEAVARGFGDRIVYVRQPNRGLPAARNRGARAATGSYLAWLDSDDILVPGSLSVRARHLDAHPDLALVCGDALMFEGARDRGLKSAAWAGRPRRPRDFRLDAVGYCAMPSTVMLRRSAFHRAGGFDETLIGGAEDWLLWMQLGREGRLEYLDRPLVRYRLHPGQATRKREALTAGNRAGAARAVADPRFGDYPARVRARLLYKRFATAWRVEPRPVALGAFARALATAPAEAPYGARVLARGLANTARRRLGRA